MCPNQSSLHLGAHSRHRGLQFAAENVLWSTGRGNGRDGNVLSLIQKFNQITVSFVHTVLLWSSTGYVNPSCLKTYVSMCFPSTYSAAMNHDCPAFVDASPSCSLRSAHRFCTSGCQGFYAGQKRFLWPMFVVKTGWLVNNGKWIFTITFADSWLNIICWLNIIAANDWLVMTT